jgi:hypothetical protein
MTDILAVIFGAKDMNQPLESALRIEKAFGRLLNFA